MRGGVLKLVVRDLTGQKFHKFHVNKLVGGHAAHNRIYECICECGNIRNVYEKALLRGNYKSCGCIRKGRPSNHFKHGDTGTRLYRTWTNMRYRCNNPNCKSFKNYGAIGIKVCSEWNDFLAFKTWALNAGYNDTLTIERIDFLKGYCQHAFLFGRHLTIERIDFLKGYCPSNCTWIPLKDQPLNSSNNHFLIYEGERYTLSSLARKFNLTPFTLQHRLQAGFDLTSALTTPPLKGKKMRDRMIYAT